MKNLTIITLSLLLSVISAMAKKSDHSRPDADTVKALETITLFYKVTPKGLELSWSPANAAPSGGVKVTASTTNQQPLYPYDGYVKWISGTGHNSCVIPLKKIASGKAHYLRICSVNAKNHSRYEALSNVIIVPPIGESAKQNPAKPQAQKKEAAKVRPNPTPQKKRPANKQTTDKRKMSHKTAKFVPVQKPRGGLTVGHKSTNLDAIPAAYLLRAKKNLSVWYGHTSHGSQITSGMRAMNRAPFTFNRDGSDGALKYVETGGDLGHKGSLGWAKNTRKYLDAGGSANVIMWSWCGGCSDNNPEGVKIYLQMMAQLEKDYPGRVFVYMTGHLDGSGKSGNLHRVNNQIREFCRKNNKVLFDFADIESCDPDGKSYLDLKCRDTCDYQDGDVRKNWAADWVKKNPDHGIDLPKSASHTHPLNGALKGRAFWAMMAHIAGWKS